MLRQFVALGAVSGVLAVLLGAFGAHALRARLGPDMLAIWQTASQYHFYHALALVLTGLAAASHGPSGPLRAGGWAFVVGTLVFSGSLYLLAFTGVRWLGAITPIGGVTPILGWALLAAAALRA